MTITRSEHTVLKTILYNYFMDARPSPELVGRPVWSDCINDSRHPSGIEGKALSGVVSSLCQKNLLGSDSECVWLTETGYQAIIEKENVL